MAMLLLPPRYVPKTREVSSESLGLAERNSAHASLRISSPTSGSERSLLPAAVNLVQMDRAKVLDKVGSTFLLVTPSQYSWNGIPESVWSNNKKMVPESNLVSLCPLEACGCLSAR